MSTDYTRQYGEALRQAEARYGRTLGDEEQKQIGEQVKQQMIEDAVVLEQAQELGLAVSDTEVARQLLEVPFLRNENGKFDEELYARYLKRRQFTRAKYEEELRDNMLRLKMKSLVFMGATISDPALRDAYIESNTKVDIQYVKVRPANFIDDVTVSSEDVSAWLTENDDVAEQTYERDFARIYQHPEQVRLRMIRLTVQNDGLGIEDLLPKINTLREELAEGGDFAKMAAKWSDDPTASQGGDMGLRPVPQLGIEALDAIRDLPVGQISRVVSTDNDVRLYLVEERIAPSVDSLDSVRDKIAETAIKQERLPGLAAAFAEEELLVKWKASGSVPEDLVQSKGLIALNTGPQPTVGPGGQFSVGPPPAMLKAARTAEVGSVLPEVYENQGNLYVGQLTAREEPDMERFETERDEIREQVLLSRRNDFFLNWVADVKAQARIE